jgi:uncharacterized protein YgfB (UPF0149 family)
MSTKINMPDFDHIADIYWRLGGMQSPSQLHGYLVGQLSVGETIDPDRWLEQVVAYIDAVEAPNEEDGRMLLTFLGATEASVKAGEMDLQLLLPDDAVEITQRIESIGQWCKGFMAGFAQGGKSIQEHQGQQQYSQDVSEAVSDVAAISQISLSDDDTDLEQSEHNIFEVTEYLRVAAITIYLECNRAAESTDESQLHSGITEPESDHGQSELGSVNNLFKKKDNKLH